MPNMSDLFPPKYSSALKAPGIPRSVSLASLPARALRLVVPARRLSSLPAATRSHHDPQSLLLHDMRNALCSLGILADLLQEPGILSSGNQHIATSVSAVTKTLRCLVDSLAIGGTDSSSAPGQSAHSTNRGSGFVAAHAPEACTRPQPASPLQATASDQPFSTTARPSTTSPVHTPFLASTSAGDAVQGCGSMLRAVAGALVPVYISVEQALPPLVMLTAELERVLMNMVRNAADAMPAGGLVRITARRALSRTSPAILIHISDNGPGIPAHVLPRIFEPGFSSKGPLGNAGQPSGLGLAIVRELVESCGGGVQVASTRHRGTTFELRIPCLQPQPNEQLILD